MSGSGPSFGLKHGSAGIKLSEELDQSGPGEVEKVGGACIGIDQMRPVMVVVF